MPHSINFARWLERFGLKTGDEPGLVNAIQPVQVVQDATALVPVEPGHLFARGGTRTAVAAVNSTFVVTTSSRGALVSVEVGTNVTSDVMWGIGPNPPTLANTVAMVGPFAMNENGNQTATVSVSMGTVAASLGPFYPSFRVLSNTMVSLDVYLRPAHTLQVTVANSNQQMNAWAVWQELERHRSQ